MSCGSSDFAAVPPALVASIRRGPLSIADAISLCARDYTAPATLDTLDTVAIGRVRASIVKHGAKGTIGIIRGTSLRSQWVKFNFRFWAAPEDGDTRRWHSGFLRYAEIVYAFYKNKRLDAIAGHSLGAAAAQIVGTSLGIPFIALASPRPLWIDPEPPNADIGVNVCRTDDLVTRVPPSWLGYKHVGAPLWFTPNSPHPGEDHRILNLEAAAVTEKEPGTWCVPRNMRTRLIKHA